MNKKLYILILFFISNNAAGQNDAYWQQRADYFIHAKMDVANHRFYGEQKVIYRNNSSDTLSKMYFHLYFNAFQPNSMMAARSLSILDPERALNLAFTEMADDEQGKVDVKFIYQNGKELDFDVFETIMLLRLAEPIPPEGTAEFELSYETSIPLLIRRAGRDSPEGIDYSMAQWFPKAVAYDDEGYHPNVYIGREFYSPFGDYDVKIEIDSIYKIAAGGILISKDTLDNGKIKYHYSAENVHDFVWAADRNYKHYSFEVDSSTIFNFYYQDLESRKATWPLLGEIMKEAFYFMNRRYGPYQYPIYNFIEGGDGGMEYPMATLITGNRSINSLVGVSVHELLHAWYHTMIATNESSYHWLDEGFATFATPEVLKHLADKGLLDMEFDDFLYLQEYAFYTDFQQSYFFEPMIMNADHYSTNYAYMLSSYYGGLVFLKQLEYVIGKEAFENGLLAYFDKWKFRSPKPIDFIRVMEGVSDMELKWYLNYFAATDGVIDYAIDSVSINEKYTEINLSRKGQIPMPVDLAISYSDGKIKYISIPSDLMFGNKKSDIHSFDIARVWRWVDRTYQLKIENAKNAITNIELDSSLRLADIDRSDNIWNSKND